MPRTRPRSALALAGLALAVLAIPISACDDQSSTTSVEQYPVFDRPLLIPPLAPSVVTADGTRVFRLTAAAGKSELVPGVRTRPGDSTAAIWDRRCGPAAASG